MKKFALITALAVLFMLFAGNRLFAVPQDSIAPEDEYGKVFILKGVAFYNQSDSLKESSYKALNKLTQRLKSQKDLSVKVVGHVTAEIPEKERVKLSALRAKAIKQYMMDQGVSEKRIMALGMGNQQPLEEEEPASPKNARVEVSFKESGKSVNYGKKYVFENVKFSSMGDTLFASSYSALDRFANQLQRNESMEIKIIGHAFTSGTDDYNMSLSLNRALTVKNYLVNKGIGPERIVCEGQGKSNPKVNKGRDARDMNNRIEVAFKLHGSADKKQFSEPRRLKNVHFKADATLKQGSEASLQKLGKLMSQKDGLRIMVFTYTTEKTGKEAVSLSLERSKKIRNYLEENFEIDPERIVLGEGGYPKTKDKPENPNWVEIRLSK